jgi:hypothetical protein
MPKMTITALRTEEITTARGKSQVYRFKMGNQWYSSFVAAWNADWKDGQEIEFDAAQVVEKKGKDGKVFYNLRAPTREGAILAKLERIEKGLEAVWKEVHGDHSKLERIEKGLEAVWKEVHGDHSVT